MDTAVMKSWYEVVRLTDPLIWSLASVDQTSLVTPDNDAAHAHHQPQHQHQHQHHPSQLKTTSLTPSSSSPSSSTRDSTVQPSHPLTHTCTHTHVHAPKNNHCRLLLDPAPQNALNWLKCLIQTSQDDIPREQGHRQQRSKEPWTALGLGTTLDHLGPVGKANSTRTRSSAQGGIHYYNQGAEEAMAVAPPTAAAASPSSSSSSSSPSSAGSHHRQHSGSGPAKSPFAGNVASDTHHVSRSENHADLGGGAGVGRAVAAVAAVTAAATAATAATAHIDSPETETAASHPLAAEQPTAAPAGAVASCAIIDTYSPSASASSNSAFTTAASSSHLNNALKTNTASSDMSSNANTIANVNAVVNVHTSTALTTATTSSSTTTTISNSTLPPTASTASITPSRLSTLMPPSFSPEILHAATDMIQDGLIRSKDATTAFLYRTFSPTYHVSKLYVDSWSNGSQKRGMDRIKNSVVRGDALSLIKGTATQMKDVWKQVMAAYRVKTATSASAAGQGKHLTAHHTKVIEKHSNSNSNSNINNDTSNPHDSSSKSTINTNATATNSSSSSSGSSGNSAEDGSETRP